MKSLLINLQVCVQALHCIHYSLCFICEKKNGKVIAVTIPIKNSFLIFTLSICNIMCTQFDEFALTNWRIWCVKTWYFILIYVANVIWTEATKFKLYTSLKKYIYKTVSIPFPDIDMSCTDTENFSWGVLVKAYFRKIHIVNIIS